MIFHFLMFFGKKNDRIRSCSTKFIILNCTSRLSAAYKATTETAESYSVHLRWTKRTWIQSRKNTLPSLRTIQKRFPQAIIILFRDFFRHQAYHSPQQANRAQKLPKQHSLCGLNSSGRKKRLPAASYICAFFTRT